MSGQTHQASTLEVTTQSNAAPLRWSLSVGAACFEQARTPHDSFCTVSWPLHWAPALTLVSHLVSAAFDFISKKWMSNGIHLVTMAGTAPSERTRHVPYTMQIRLQDAVIGNGCARMQKGAMWCSKDGTYRHDNLIATSVTLFEGWHTSPCYNLRSIESASTWMEFIDVQALGSKLIPALYEKAQAPE